MELLVLDSPLVQELGMPGILDADDVQASRSRVAILHTADVGVRTGQVLLDIDIRDAQRGAQRKVAEHFDIVASSLQRCRLGLEPSRCERGKRDDRGEYGYRAGGGLQHEPSSADC